MESVVSVKEEKATGFGEDFLNGLEENLYISRKADAFRIFYTQFVLAF